MSLTRPATLENIYSYIQSLIESMEIIPTADPA